VVNRLHKSRRLWFLFTGAQTHHLRSLAARELLQEDFPAVGKTDPIAICERFQALLNKRNFLDCTHTQAPLQILWDIVQSQPRAWWHAHRWEVRRQ
jgi:hypothetical protein